MRNKLFRRRFAITIASFFAFILVLWFVYNNILFAYNNIHTREMTAITESNLLSVLDREFSGMTLATALIAGSDSVQDFLLEKDTQEYFRKSGNVSGIIRGAAFPTLSEGSILTVTADGAVFQFMGSISGEGAEKIKREIFSGGISSHTVIELDGTDFFCLVTPVFARGADSDGPVGYVAALSNMTKARRILTEPDTPSGMDTAVVMDGVILFSSNPELDGRNAAELETLYGSVSTAQVTGSNLYAVTAVSRASLNYGWELFVVTSFAALVIFALTAAAMYRWMSARMVSPMLETADNMRVGLLTLQISAHFVVNTISCIKGLAENGENDMAAEAAEHLAGMLRVLHESGEENNIFSELENLDRYIRIMNIRHNGRYEAEIDADDRLIKYKMQSHVLQPLVENAITHGLSPKEGGCRVTVTGRLEEDSVTFEITDNGIGMEAAQITALQEMLNTASEWDYGEYRLKGVALTNIQKRIRARYGESYGLTFSGAPLMGITVRVRLPVIRDEGEGRAPV